MGSVAPSILQVPGARELAVEGFSIDLTGEVRSVTVGGERVLVSYHDDAHRMVAASLAQRALTVPRRASESDRESFAHRTRKPHPRYACPDLLSYIEGFALPPFIASAPARVTEPAPASSLSAATA